MNNEVEKELRNSRNSFELEGNVANISDVYVNKNGKQMLRFDLAQNNNGNTQFVPILLRGELINSYGKEIQKGDWISVKGRIEEVRISDKFDVVIDYAHNAASLESLIKTLRQPIMN